MRTAYQSHLLGYPLTNENSSILDLSRKKLKELSIDASSNEELQGYIFNGKIRYGGYGEQRDIYSRSTAFTSNEQVRDIHLGLDIWHISGTPLYSPWDGKLISAYDNDAFGDYGPTLIIQHQIDHELIHVLYGHLSRETLGRWKAGDLIEQGALLGHMGDESENGGWPPHVHLQMIKDLEGNTSDYPGVCSEADQPKYRDNCPDPSMYFLQSS